MKRNLGWALMGLVGLLLAEQAMAATGDEALLHKLPPGYEEGFRGKNGNMITIEYVLQGQTVENWSEMVTTQIIPGGHQVPPAEFLQGMKDGWSKSCPGSEVIPIREGQENGHPFAFWYFVCPRNPGTGKPEHTWMKAIQGDESFYVVQKAFKFAPTDEQVVHWTKYLRDVVVQDVPEPGTKH